MPKYVNISPVYALYLFMLAYTFISRIELLDLRKNDNSRKIAKYSMEEIKYCLNINYLLIKKEDT